VQLRRGSRIDLARAMDAQHDLVGIPIGEGVHG
jgi:hypothetical protein